MRKNIVAVSLSVTHYPLRVQMNLNKKPFETQIDHSLYVDLFIHIIT